MTVVLLAALFVADDVGVPCGAACTYLLVRESRPEVTLRKAVERLPDRTDGHSFTDLLSAADSLGVSASVVNIKESGRLPREPFVAHFQRADGGPIGHFVFVRPLEPTFAQYQMIAAPFEPEVVFASDILARTDFSGWVMTRSKPNLAAWFGAGLIAVAAGLFATQRLLTRRPSLEFAFRNVAPAR